VKMAETYAELLHEYTQGLLQDLWPHLDAEGRAKAPQLVRRRLILLDSGVPDDDHPVIEQTAIEAA